MSRNLALRHSRGVIEFRLSGEQFEADGVEVQFGGGEAGACIEELDLTDHALVALATCDAERRTSRLGPSLGRSQRGFAGLELVEGLLHLELDLLRDLFAARAGLLLGDTCFANLGATRTAIEQRPVE